MKKVLCRITACLFVLSLVHCSEQTNDENEQIEDITPPKIYKKVHGISEEQYLIDSSSVGNGQSFGEILQKHGVSFSTINYLSENYKETYDIRRIYPGDNYYTYSQKDTAVLSKFIYQHSPTEIVVMNFEDSVYMEVVQKPVVIKLKESGGNIKSSLWQSFIDHDLTPALVTSVANLYAWTIDFFDVQPGDKYKIIYEAKYVEGKFIGVGDIKAVVFNHLGRDLYAFHYASPVEKIKHYYDEKGESMQRALLSAPLEYIRISSKFSHRRMHPIKKVYTPHYGVDYAAPSGTEVVATGDGKVIFAGRAGGAGNMIKIKHTFGNVETKYLHLLRFAKGIKVGSFVEQGQKIAEVGSTGLSTGPHLDYRVYIDGKPQNPLKMNIPSKDPIPEDFREQYLKDISVLKSTLDKININ